MVCLPFVAGEHTKPTSPGHAPFGADIVRGLASQGTPMPPRIVVVPPSHAEIAEIAKRMAPAGFEVVVSRADRASLDQVMPTAEYIVCYPNVASDDAFYKSAPKL